MITETNKVLKKKNNFKNENKLKKNNGTYYEFFKKFFSFSYI